jgi:hypothetical protein
MATATKTNPSDLNIDLDAASEQVKQLNDRLLETGKRVGNFYVDSYENTVKGVTEFQRKLADQSQNEVVKSVLDAQVDLTRQIAGAYTTAVRKVLA